MNACHAARLSVFALLCAIGLSAHAGPSADARYQAEVARCNSGQSQQDRDTCLKEARNARADAARGRLDNGQQGRYDANAMARCDNLPPADKADCVGRMHGQGSVSGSVEGGGLYREKVTVEPAAPADDGTSTSGTRAAPGSASDGTLSTPPMQPTR
jgi:hypothetical protein